MNRRPLRGPMVPSFAREQIEVRPADPPKTDRKVDAAREAIQTVFPSLEAVDRVAQTTAPWSGIDVYVNPPVVSLAHPGCLSVFVWAVTQGVRMLAATGRLTPGPYGPAGLQVAGTKQRTSWVAGARGLADSWEVTAVWQQLAGDPQPVGPCLFSVVASNAPAELPPELGAVPWGTAIGDDGIVSRLFEAAGFYPQQLELLSVSGVNGAAAARYLHIWDVVVTGAALPAAINGGTPLFSFPLGAAIGGGFVTPPNFRYRARDSLIAVISSTLATTNVVFDGILSGLVR